MSDEEVDSEEAPKKKSKLPIILGLVLAIAGGGGGFFAAWSGMILAPSAEALPEEKADSSDDLSDIAFIPLDPLVVAITGEAQLSHLRFRAELEVPTSKVEDVELLKPRVIDVLNSYLRALQTSDISDVSSLARLRAQMLRRVQVVLGPDRVNDLLIMEFVIN